MNKKTQKMLMIIGGVAVAYYVYTKLKSTTATAAANLTPAQLAQQSQNASIATAASQIGSGISTLFS